jgi:hypothetical protein
MFRALSGIRVLVFTVAIGLFLINSGWDNLELRQGTGASPVDVNVEQIEAGTLPESAYWKVGEHVAVTQVGVYEYSAPKGATGEPGAGTPVTVYYYPIISKAAAARVDATGEFRDFTVVVKTRRFRTVGALPKQASEERGIEGMAISRVVPLGKKERVEFLELFPNADLDKLVILEEGRTPATALGSYARMAGGGALCLVWPVAACLTLRRGRKEAQAPFVTATAG